MMDFMGDSKSDQDDQTAFGGPGLRVPAKGDSSSGVGPSGPTGKSSGDAGADAHADFGATVGAHAIPEGSVSGRPPSSHQSPDQSYRDVTLQIGEVIQGRYEILQLLGQGGMGSVYKARDSELDRLVALKIIRPDLATNQEILQRFKQELILARQVTHRNVIRIFDLSQADGLKFITMEYLEGQDLRQVLREKGKLTPQEAARVILQICRALEAAHIEGVIHRDLKPQNIMLDQKGRAYVMDFGIARSVHLPGMTQTGALVGTPEYMSPEQAKGEKLDERSDLFSLGVILYELLVGQSPYYSETPLATLWKRIQEKAKPLSEVDPTVPKALSDIVEKALEIEPKDRFASATEFALSLETFLGPSAQSSMIFLPAPKTTHYWKWASAALAVLLISALVTFRLRTPSKPKAAHAPVSVLVADFTNHTGDPIFDDALEPMFNFALEGASFINAFDRGNARKLAGQLPHPTDKLDEQPARLIALSQGIVAVVTGELSRRGDKYSLSATALDAASGNVIAKTEATAANKDEVLLTIPKLAAPIRQALGDTTSESAQLQAAGGAFTAASLEVVHLYGIAMKQQSAGQLQEALQSFSKAAEMDPNFARAYSGISAAYGNLGQPSEAEKYAKLAMQHIDRMTERERYRLRGYYYADSGNWDKCIEEYSGLVKRYPDDNIGHNNLANCYSQVRNWPKAIDEARQDVNLQLDAQGLSNLALFSSYGGDFQGGEREARRLQQLMPSFEYGYLSLAFAQSGKGDLPQATETYKKLASTGALGSSMAAAGQADLDLFQGRLREAARILEQGAAADLAAKRTDAAADKFAALAHTRLLQGQRQEAVTATDKALSASQAAKIRFLAARIFVDAEELPKAQTLAAGLASDIRPDPQAYAKIINGSLALKRGDRGEAIKHFTEANNLLDTWIGHFELGRAYVDAGAFAEATSEFDHCISRRGETLALFLDEVPTSSYFPPVYYYLGRAEEGLGGSGAVDTYGKFVSMQAQGDGGALFEDAKKRLAQLTAKK
jgi:serine/threonine protein kinase/Flp pilus assembly protein TadD